ncbi:UNKNOWN [Stylonychia lemnae]|uniref:Uncharacterized protein n=1 Tax=Stylonychia lemnae TaxID=5949 RepID=A0A077ZT72_STYLE|nr:UNKNOWN [Stylonychia lemnae]|eukprot:CDW72515.1 UNKNOWN [Stylonychia lemnae]
MAFYKINKFITLSNHTKETKLTLADHLSLIAQIDPKTKDDIASQVPKPFQTNNLSNSNVHLHNKQSKISLSRICILINEKKSIQYPNLKKWLQEQKQLNDKIFYVGVLSHPARLLDQIFRRIQENEANSKIIVMSYFNRDHIIKVQKIMGQYNLIPIIQDQPKNIAGNRLDLDIFQYSS